MLLSNIKFGAYLTYAPRGTSNMATQAKDITLGIKSDRQLDNGMTITQFYAHEIKEKIGSLPFTFLDPNSLLIPIPKSALMRKEDLWVPKNIARALSNVGLGKTSACLTRAKSISKAATANPKDRPSAIEHYESLKIRKLCPSANTIVLVDDVITRGAALLGSASRIRETYPGATIFGFALMRTISDEKNFTKLIDPCLGEVTLQGYTTFRTP